MTKIELHVLEQINSAAASAKVEAHNLAQKVTGSDYTNNLDQRINHYLGEIQDLIQLFYEDRR